MLKNFTIIAVIALLLVAFTSPIFANCKQAKEKQCACCACSCTNCGN